MTEKLKKCMSARAESSSSRVSHLGSMHFYTVEFTTSGSFEEIEISLSRRLTAEKQKGKLVFNQEKSTSFFYLHVFFVVFHDFPFQFRVLMRNKLKRRQVSMVRIIFNNVVTTFSCKKNMDISQSTNPCQKYLAAVQHL